MPAIGDQHKSQNAITANPFEETRQRCAEYTAQEIATLQSRLDKQLGPEYISSRPGAAGQKVHYLAAEKVINLANEIFGFNGWSSSIQNIQIDFVDENQSTGKITLGLSVIVRVTLKDGTYHEDIGYGHIENCKGKAAAFEKAKKEGTTDALKRSLRTFGNVLGNCIYDKDYVQKVTKVKVGASRWDVEALHRHPDFVPRRTEDVVAATKMGMPSVNNETNTSGSNTVSDSFDMADFDDAEFDENEFGHPDEVVLPAEPAEGWQMIRPPNQRAQSTTTPNADRIIGSSGINNLVTPRDNGRQALNNTPIPISNSNTRASVPHQHANNFIQQNSNQRSSSPGIPSDHFPAPVTTGRPPVAGFYSARAAPLLDADNNPPPNVINNPAILPIFNPHAESPSIRKTQGVDHSKSTRLKKDLRPDPVPPPRPNSTDPRPDNLDTRRTGVTAIGAGGPTQGHQSISSIQNPGLAGAGGGASTLSRPAGFTGGISGGSAYRPPTRRATDSVSGSVPVSTSATAVNTNMTGNPNVSTSMTTTGGGGSVDRVLAQTGASINRTPLSDVSNVQYHHHPQQHAQANDPAGNNNKNHHHHHHHHNNNNTTNTIMGNDGPDFKRQKLSTASGAGISPG